VEQTQDSTRLDKFQFPVKTVLLLGNEKEGIPVELIQVKLKLLLHGTKKMG
jgi:tRNA guanosine-2'-O-methyltransferase